MGRTLLGVDLDESHVGEFVKRLLTDEELEKLADGGRPADDDRDEPDADGDASDGDASDDTDDQGDDTGTDTDTGSSESGGSSVSVGSATGSVGGRDWTGTDDTDWLDDQDDDEGRLGGYGPLVLKGGAVVLVLVVVALVVWRYGGRVKEAVPFVGGSGTSGEGDVADDQPAAAGADDAVSPARRRAKVGGRDEGGDAGSGTDSGGSRVNAGGESREGVEPGVEAVGRDVDLGALVGLGTLALVAALVRKFGEQRPRDPLVDGPDDEESAGGS